MTTTTTTTATTAPSLSDLALLRMFLRQPRRESNIVDVAAVSRIAQALASEGAAQDTGAGLGILVVRALINATDAAEGGTPDLIGSRWAFATADPSGPFYAGNGNGNGNGGAAAAAAAAAGHIVLAEADVGQARPFLMVQVRPWPGREELASASAYSASHASNSAAHASNSAARTAPPFAESLGRPLRVEGHRDTVWHPMGVVLRGSQSQFQYVTHLRKRPDLPFQFRMHQEATATEPTAMFSEAGPSADELATWSQRVHAVLYVADTATDAWERSLPPLAGLRNLPDPFGGAMPVGGMLSLVANSPDGARFLPEADTPWESEARRQHLHVSSSSTSSSSSSLPPWAWILIGVGVFLLAAIALGGFFRHKMDHAPFAALHVPLYLPRRNTVS